MDLMKDDMMMAYFIDESVAGLRVTSLIVCVFVTSLSIM